MKERKTILVTGGTQVVSYAVFTGAAAYLDREFGKRPAGEHVRERRDWMFLRGEMLGEAVEVSEEQAYEMVDSRFRDFLKRDKTTSSTRNHNP